MSSPPIHSPSTNWSKFFPSSSCFHDPFVLKSLAVSLLIFTGFLTQLYFWGQGLCLLYCWTRSSTSSPWHRVNILQNLSTYDEFSEITCYHSNVNLIHVLCALRGSLSSALLSCLPCWSVTHGSASPLLVKIPNTDIKRLESLSSPSPNWHLSQKRVLWTQETDFLPERVSIATTASSKVPECLPPTSDFLPPRVPFRWHQAVGMSLRSPYQMFHSWQEQVYLLNKLHQAAERLMHNLPATPETRLLSSALLSIRNPWS